MKVYSREVVLREEIVTSNGIEQGKNQSPKKTTIRSQIETVSDRERGSLSLSLSYLHGFERDVMFSQPIIAPVYTG